MVVTCDHSNRRRFLCAARVLALVGAGLALMAGCSLLPTLAPASGGPARVHRIGYLSAMSESSPELAAFQQGLRQLGYVEEQNLAIEYRFTRGSNERFPDLAAELVGLEVHLIVTSGDAAARAAKQATSAIPIVVAAASDPVRSRLVASLARPGGNVTGVTNFAPELVGKRLELLKQAYPAASRIGVLWSGIDAMLHEFGETQVATEALGAQRESLPVQDPSQLQGAFAAASGMGVDSVLVIADIFTSRMRTEILALMDTHRLPAMYTARGFVEGGGLMSYGPGTRDLQSRAATYVDRILKGAKPADLPVEQPTRFELVINLKTAQALGLTIPQSVLLQATEVVQ